GWTGATGVVKAGSVITLIGIHTRTPPLEERAAMRRVGAGFRRDLNLRAAETAVFSIVGVREHMHIVDRLFCGRNNGGSAPHGAHRADTVDRNAVVFILIAVSQGLRTILRGEDAAVARRSARALSAGQAKCAARAGLRHVADGSRRELA